MPTAIPSHILQMRRYNSTGGGPLMTDVRVELPHASLAGNTIVIDMFFGPFSGVTPTITDDQGNTWPAAIESPTDSGNDMRGYCFAMIGAATGTKKIRIQFSGTGAHDLEIKLYEACQVTAVDTHHSQANAASTSWAAGSFTTTANGDWIHTAAMQDSTAGPFSAFSPQTGYALSSGDRIGGFATQDGIQSSLGAINPTITGQSLTNVTIGVSFKLSAGVGTALPSGVWRILSAEDYFFSGGTTFTGYQFPCRGNMIEGSWQGGSATAANGLITNFTDSNSNSITRSTANNVASAGATQHVYCVAATTSSDMTFTLTSDRSDNVSNLTMYDVQAPAGAAFGQTVNGSGVMPSGTSLVTQAITPGSSNSIIFGVLGVNASTVDAETTVFSTVHPFDPVNENGNASSWHEDNGWFFYITSNTTARTATFNVFAAVADWSEQYAEFTATAASTVTPAPGKSLNEARARFKTRSRLAQLREHGHTWFRAILPAVPLRNTTLVPAKWLELSSRIGGTVIQRATTGITSIVVAGRTASTKRVQRAILTRGRFVNKNGVAMRVPTGTPATWLLSNSVIGSATIQRPTTGTTSALFTQRDHTEHQLQRRLRSSGAVTARTWLPPPPLVIAVKIHRYVFLRRTRDEFIKTRRLRPTAVIAKTGLPVIPALGWIPKPPAVLLLRKGHDQRARVAHERPSTVLARAPLAAPPPPPTKKVASFLFLRRIRDQQLHIQRRATVIAYDTSLLIVPAPTTALLAGAHGWQGDARVGGAPRVHLRHDRASVTTRQLPPPTSPAPGNIRRIAFFILGRERAERRLRATIADRGRLYAHTWLPGPQPVTPALPRGLVLTARSDRAHQARLRHEKTRFTGISWIPLRLPNLVSPPPRLRLGQIIDGRVASDRRIRLLRDQAHVRSWRYVTTPLGRILTGTLHLEPVFTTSSLAVAGALDATLAIQPPE